MQMDLHRKHALVCGASQGIGLAAAKELASMGARCTLMARNEERLRLALGTLEGEGHGVAVADFTDAASVSGVAAAVAQTRWTHPDQQHGRPSRRPGPAADQCLPRCIQSAPALCNQRLVQAVLPGMRAAGGGRIVNVISTSVKQPLDGLGVSNTVRGAVANWAKTLANELGLTASPSTTSCPGPPGPPACSRSRKPSRTRPGSPPRRCCTTWPKPCPSGSWEKPTKSGPPLPSSAARQPRTSAESTCRWTAGGRVVSDGPERFLCEQSGRP